MSAQSHSVFCSKIWACPKFLQQKCRKLSLISSQMGSLLKVSVAQPGVYPDFFTKAEPRPKNCKQKLVGEFTVLGCADWVSEAVTLGRELLFQNRTFFAILPKMLWFWKKNCGHETTTQEIWRPLRGISLHSWKLNITPQKSGISQGRMIRSPIHTTLGLPASSAWFCHWSERVLFKVHVAHWKVHTGFWSTGTVTS